MDASTKEEMKVVFGESLEFNPFFGCYFSHCAS